VAQMQHCILVMNTLRVTLLNGIEITQNILVLIKSTFSLLMWNGPLYDDDDDDEDFISRG